MKNSPIFDWLTKAAQAVLAHSITAIQGAETVFEYIVKTSPVEYAPLLVPTGVQSTAYYIKHDE